MAMTTLPLGIVAVVLFPLIAIVAFLSLKKK